MAAWQILTGIGVGAGMALVLMGLVRLPAPSVSRPLFGFVVCGGLWASGDSIATLAGDLPHKRLGLAILYTGAIYLPSFWWISTLRWAAERDHLLRVGGPWGIRAPLLWASAMWAVMITNPWHGLFITPVIGGRNVYQPLWWWMAIPNYLLIGGAVLIQAGVVWRTRVPAVRRQAAFLIAASLVTLVGNAVYVFARLGFNGTHLVLSASALLLFVGMFREGAFGVLPVALRVLAENDPDGLVVVSSGGRVAYLNPRARDLLAPIGVGLDAKLPQALRGIAHEADGSPLGSHETDWERAWWETLARPEGALCRVGRDGAKWLHMSARGARGRSGRLRAICLRLRDITSERNSELRMRRTQRLESVAGLSRGIAHDVRNMLTVVRGNAELLASELPDDAALQRKLLRIIEAGRHAGELADQLQLYAGGASPSLARAALSEVLREMAELLLPDLDDTVRLELQLGDDPLFVQADATQLRQILSNLLVNACEAIPEEGGVITASAGSGWLDPAGMEDLVVGGEEPAGAYAWVRVADTGVGMDPATQERLFEPFFSTKGKHRGVGLSSTPGIVRAHGGLLQLQTRQGHGSSFGLYLPLEREPGATGPATDRA